MFCEFAGVYAKVSVGIASAKDFLQKCVDGNGWFSRLALLSPEQIEKNETNV
jgi:hypothetical protein